jgi:hypothetical protein
VHLRQYCQRAQVNPERKTVKFTPKSTEYFFSKEISYQQQTVVNEVVNDCAWKREQHGSDGLSGRSAGEVNS